MLNQPSPGVLASARRIPASHSLFAWGNNGVGQLGDGTQGNKSSPVPIGAATNWTAIAFGGNTSICVRGGALFTCGNNGAGQLGDGTILSKSSPVPIGAATNWTAVAGGFAINATALGIRGGALFSWGNNNTGQLGDGTTQAKSSPVPIGAATNWTAIAASGSATTASFGISGGALFAWGAGANGQLGNGTITNKSSPVPIGAATDWTAIAAGGGALGIRGGALFAWGANNNGQLGDGTNLAKSSPVPIGAATNWTAVAQATACSFGISGGALFAWGYGGNGQLGNGTTTNKSSPVPIGAATDWTAIAAGGGATLGIRGGALFAWGYNANGQLGDGTTQAKSSPVPIGAATNWTAIAQGTISSVQGNSLAIRG